MTITATPLTVQLLSDYKGRAQVFSARLAHDGHRIKHNHALELLAATMYAANWRTLHARPIQELPPLQPAVEAAQRRAAELGLRLPDRSLYAAVAVSRNPVALLAPLTNVQFDIDREATRHTPPILKASLTVEVPEDAEGDTTRRSIAVGVPDEKHGLAQALLRELPEYGDGDEPWLLPPGPYGYAEMGEDGMHRIIILPDDPPGEHGTWESIMVEEVRERDTLQVNGYSPFRVMMVKGFEDFELIVVDQLGLTWHISTTDDLRRLNEVPSIEQTRLTDRA